jgi:MHS family proline/betaine transporter-like MFS transporter
MSSDRPADTHGKNLWLLAAGFIGNVVEWYDFAVYGFFAGTIGSLFFPSDDPTSSLIAAFGAFAAGFLMRPLGSIVLGHVGDRLGRKKLLVFSVLAMGLSTFAIGLLPTNADIGATAAVLMVLLRMIQGVSVGGEYVGSGVFLAERAPPHRRGLFAALCSAGLMGGMLLGSAVGALITNLLTADQITAWGWRLPFLAGLLLGGVALALRLTIPDEQLPENRSRAPLIEAITQHGKGIFLGVVIIMVLAATWYITFIYMPTWLVRHMNVSRATVLGINSVNMLLAIIAGFGAAALSDRIGRKPVLLFTTAGMAVLAYPLFVLMNHHDLLVVASAQFGLGALAVCHCFVLPSTLSEIFPWRVRTTAANLALNIPFALFGGTAPMVAAWLVAETGGTSAVAAYLSILGILSVVACLFLRDGRGIVLS